MIRNFLVTHDSDAFFIGYVLNRNRGAPERVEQRSDRTFITLERILHGYYGLALQTDNPVVYRNDEVARGQFLRRRFRQGYILRRGQHFGTGGVHQQEKYQDGKDIHQRHHVQRGAAP